MVFEYTNSKKITYYLNCKKRHNGLIYFFSKNKRETSCDLPKDREVFEAKNTSLPLLRKKK